MTRKNYVSIANHIKRTLDLGLLANAYENDGFHAAYMQGAKDMVQAIANACKEDNNRFDQDRFFDACGLGNNS